MSASAPAVGVTYDAGMLIAVDRGDRAALALHSEVLSRHHRVPTVPAGVLAQVWRSPRQALLARVLRSCDVESLSPDQARSVGVLCRSSGHPDVVDVSVVEGALRREDDVVTSDPHDLVRAGLPPDRMVIV